MHSSECFAELFRCGAWNWFGSYVSQVEFAGVLLMATLIANSFSMNRIWLFGPWLDLVCSQRF
jgi:hypothetical protein